VSFLLQKIDPPKATLLEVRSPRLTIGRGTNADLRSENASVALEHAVVEQRAGVGYEIYDCGSITGTYVNERPIERQMLGAGDRIEIGDLVITVQVADPKRPMFLRVEKLRQQTDAAGHAAPREEEPQFQTGAQMRAPKIDFSKAYALRQLFLSKRSMTISLLLLATAVLAVVTLGGASTMYQPGPISVAHETASRPSGERVIAPGDCGACHTPFGGATDEKCSGCHQQLFHQSRLAVVGPCIDCHPEHRNVRQLAQVHQRKCVDCHRSLEGKGITAARSITAFDRDHPDFSVVLAGDRRLPVTSPTVKTGDPIALVFDHECHLSGKCSYQPPTPENPERTKVDLSCDSCHKFDPETGTALQVRYDTACAACHPLTFDNRYAPVPHGLTLPTVAGVISNAYAGNEEILSRPAAEVARIFATRKLRPREGDSQVVRNAQRVMEVRCRQCHLVSPDGRSVVPPGSSRSWFAGMRPFDHHTHMSSSLELACAHCHESVARSRSAADLSLPSIEHCTGCHRASEGFSDAGLGSCIMCHSYHEPGEDAGAGRIMRASLGGVVSSGLPHASAQQGQGEGGEGDVLFMAAIWSILTIGGVIVIAILVVAAVAAFLVARRQQREVNDALADVGAESMIRKKAPAADAPSASPRESESAAPPPKPPPPDKTVAVQLPPPPPADGTMMIEWRGSMVGVSGVLEGKRLPIDSGKGFYIGRDKEVADVVVEDSRISRRHVWVGLEGDDVVAIDQGSTNGTFVNDEKITKRKLEPGDVLVLADQAVALRYEP
jgi:pSer/pThr/pTyr-binding forkhead associated (FHA) protein